MSGAGSTTLLTTSSPIETDLIADEGVRTKPYRDSRGFLTVGVGHNLDAAGLCPDAILAQLRFDIQTAQSGLDRIAPWWRFASQPVQRVLTNLSFNIGANKLAAFTQFLGLLQVGRLSEAASDLLTTTYAQQVPARAARLAAMLKS